MKFGKKPARYDPKTLRLADYRTTALPTPPATFGHAAAYTDWQMLANDRVGCCVFAGFAHSVMEWTKLAGAPVLFDDTGVLSDYTAVTGYDPSQMQPDGSNPTDQGTDVQTALAYWKKIGVVDAAGARHKIAGYVALEPGNWDELLEGIWLFDTVGVGFQVPGSAMQQFQAGQRWSYVGDMNIVGGHYVPDMGHPGVSLLSLVTWARRQVATRRFVDIYTDEAYAILSPDAIRNASGKSPEGYNWAQLEADLAAL